MEIKEAVEAHYTVSVVDVRSARLQGKPKSSRRRRSRDADGHRANTKRAYVTLKSGDKLPIFDSIEADGDHDHDHADHDHSDHDHDHKDDKKSAKGTK